MLFSSHILEEVERLARHIEVVVAGRHAASGDFRKIRRLMTDRPHRYGPLRDDRRARRRADRRPVRPASSWPTAALRVQAVDFEAFTTLLPRVARDRRHPPLQGLADRRVAGERLPYLVSR